MPGRLTHRHAIVTGAGSGIGAAIARALAAEGAFVSLLGRRHAPLEALAAEIGTERAEAIANVDVTDRQAINRGLTVARGRFGPIDILVNNAGEAPSIRFDRMTSADWAGVMALNLTAVFEMTQAALPDLTASRPAGRIISIASTAGLKGYSHVSAYCAAKHGVIGLTRSLALELVKTGITVNAVCPGYTDTPMVRDAAAAIATKTGRDPEEVIAGFTRDNPQSRLVTPEEVADAVVWLTSPAASAINGQAIVVAGGEVMAG